jgi:hypothetical protein
MPPKRRQRQPKQASSRQGLETGFDRLKHNDKALIPPPYIEDTKWNRKIRLHLVGSLTGTVTFAQLKAAIGVNAFTRVAVHRIDGWVLNDTSTTQMKIVVTPYLASGTTSTKFRDFEDIGIAGIQAAHVAIRCGKANPPFIGDTTVICGYSAGTTSGILLDFMVSLFDTATSTKDSHLLGEEPRHCDKCFYPPGSTECPFNECRLKAILQQCECDLCYAVAGLCHDKGSVSSLGSLPPVLADIAGLTP